MYNFYIEQGSKINMYNSRSPAPVRAEGPQIYIWTDVLPNIFGGGTFTIF